MPARKGARSEKRPRDSSSCVPRRVSALTIKGWECKTTSGVEAQWERLLTGALEVCQAAETKHTTALLSTVKAHPALTFLHIVFEQRVVTMYHNRDYYGNYNQSSQQTRKVMSRTPVFRELTTKYAMVTHGVQTLHIAHSGDEGFDLCGLTALPQLGNLQLIECVLPSAIPLLWCRALTVVNLSGCQQLTSLDGLQNHVLLKVISAAHTKITSLCGLLGCSALLKVDVGNCTELNSLDGLQNLGLLEVITACDTRISSLKELQHCPSLTKVVINNCKHLRSLEGLKGHVRLRELDASNTSITSIEGVFDCPLKSVNFSNCHQLTTFGKAQRLQQLEVISAQGAAISSIEALGLSLNVKKIDLSNCQQLASLKGLQKFAQLVEISASNTAITSLQELLNCNRLITVTVDDCQQLTSLNGLQDHPLLEEISAAGSRIMSVRELLKCPRLRKVNVSGCSRLTSLDGLQGHALLKEVDASGSAITSVLSLMRSPALTTLRLHGCKLA